MATGPVEFVAFPGLPRSAGFFLQRDEYSGEVKCSNPRCQVKHSKMFTYADDCVPFHNRLCWAMTMLPAYAVTGGLTIFNRFGKPIPKEKVTRIFREKGIMPPLVSSRAA